MKYVLKYFFFFYIAILSIAGISLFISCGPKSNSEHPTDMVNIPASSDEDIDEDELPAMKFEEEIFDFGTITQGEKVSHVFKFKNVGNKPLLIANAFTSCGCTVPVIPKQAIATDESSEIKVTFDSEGKSGIVTKEITLMTNCIPNKKVIKIKANIFTPQTQNPVKP